MSKPETGTKETPMKENVAETASAEFLTKLTLKGIGCNPRIAATENKKVALARIYGVATGIKTKVDPKGDVFEAIEGSFEAVNLKTGEVYRSGLLFLPGGIHETLTGSLKKGGDGATIRFGLEVSAIPASNPIGYSYSARSLIPDAGDDLLADMRKSVMSLPAPKA